MAKRVWCSLMQQNVTELINGVWSGEDTSNDIQNQIKQENTKQGCE
jgi:hypothetical protein